MDFLEISMFYYPTAGGGSKTTDSMVKALSKKGHRIHLVYPVFTISPSSLQDNTIIERKVPNIKLYPVYIKPRLLYNYLRIYDWITFSHIYKQLFKKCNTILKSENIDYIISHFHEGTQIGLVGHTLSVSYNLPHIVKVHDIYAFHSLNPEVIYSVKNYFNSKKTLKNSNIILFPNKSMLSMAIERYSFDKTKSIILPNGLNFKDYELYNKIKKLTDQEINLVFVGGLYRNRKLNPLLKALNELNLNLTPKLNFSIIGDGSEKNKLIKIINKYNLKFNVNIFGYLSNNKVLDIIDKSHIGIGFMEKNKLSEFQMPIKIIEYMAMGLPWISVKHNGIIELNESKSGIILENSSPESIKSAILSLITDPQKYESMSKAGKTYSKEHFDWDKNIQILLEMIKGDLDGKTYE